MCRRANAPRSSATNGTSSTSAHRAATAHCGAARTFGADSPYSLRNYYYAVFVQDDSGSYTTEVGMGGAAGYFGSLTTDVGSVVFHEIEAFSMFLGERNIS